MAAFNSSNLTSKSENLTIACKATQNNNFTYMINSSPITKTEAVKDLGVILADNLKWDKHIDKLFSRATNLIYINFKTFKYINFNVNLLKLFIRPILEYNVNVLAPYQKGDRKRI